MQGLSMAMGGRPCGGRCPQRARPPARPYPGQMSRPRPTTHAVISLALWPLIIIFSPVILLAGEPVNRYVMRQVRRSASTAQIPVVRHGGRAARAAAGRLPLRTSLLLTVISNPLWIALTAPGRWVSDRFRRHPPRAGGPVSAP
jgi:hypothetical protein